MTENTTYEFKLKILTLEIFNLSISSTAATGKVIAAGTVFAVGLLLVIGAYADKVHTLIQYFTK
jgi:uncharacterized membrane protein